MLSESVKLKSKSLVNGCQIDSKDIKNRWFLARLPDISLGYTLNLQLKSIKSIMLRAFNDVSLHTLLKQH